MVSKANLLPANSFLTDSLSRVVNGALLLFVVLWFALDTAQRGPRQVVSFFGLILFILLIHVFSKHPFRVRDSTATVIVC